MYLYVYDGYKGGPQRQKETEYLILKAVELFINEKNISCNRCSREIYRTEKGKPAFRELPVEFSVSHTGNLWVCLMSDKREPVGVDIQMVKDNRYERVTERYFTEEEKEYVKKNGPDSFFTIWTRKEAYAKYTGNGITKELAAVSTLDNSEVEFTDFDIRTGIKGSCCIKEKGDLCLRTI